MSTTENLAVVIWRNVAEQLEIWKRNKSATEDVNEKKLENPNAQLFEIKIHETDKNIVVYRGD